MPRPRRRAALVAALVALVAGAGVAGCGSGGTDVARANRYVAEVNQAQSAFARTVTRLSDRVTAHSSASSDRATLRSFTDAVDGVVSRLRRIDPPARVAGLHRRLVSDMGTYGRRVHSAAASLRSGDASRLVGAQQRLLQATSTVSTQINRTIDAINRALRRG